MNKRDRLLQYKQIRNGLPRYDLAAKQTASGYQKSDNFNIGTPSIQQGYDNTEEVNNQTANIVPNALRQGIGTYQTINSLPKNPFGNGVYQATRDSILRNAAKNIASQNYLASTANAMMPTLTQPTTTIAGIGMNSGQVLGPSFTQQVANFGKNAFKSTANSSILSAGNSAMPQTLAQQTGAQTAKEASKEAAKQTLKSAGTALNIAASAYGLYDLTNSLISGPKIPTAQQMDQAKNITTQSVNGVDYNTLSLGNTNAEKMLSNAETSRAISNTIKGAGTGFAIGSFLPGLGNVIGAGIGALIGGVGSLFGRNRRKRELRRRKEALISSYANQNKQAESIAASEGLRNEFDNDTYTGTSLYNADKGKTAVSYNLMNRPNQGSYGMVFDKDGYHLGPINSKVGKGETIVNFNEGKMTYIDKGKKRADDQYSSVQEGDNNYIAGNDIDWTNGRSFADQVAPMSKQYAKNEKLRKLIESNKNADNKTKELNLKQLDLMQQQLVESTKEPLNRQEMQHKIQNTYDGTMPQYDKGKFNLNWLQPLIYAGAYGIPNSQYNYYKNSAPQAANSYVRNSNADRALSILGQMHFDPYQQAQQVRDAYRQGIYNINQQGGLSAGQRTKMLAAHGNNYMMNMAKLYGEANDINNKYKQAYAQALMEAGEKDAARQQTALAQQQQAYREAVARRLLGMESANQGRLNMLGALGKNLFQQQEFEGAQDYNNKLINLYDRQADIQERGFAKDAANGNNAGTKVQIDFNPFVQSFGGKLSKPKAPAMYSLSNLGYPSTDDSGQYNRWESKQPYYFQNFIPRIY